MSEPANTPATPDHPRTALVTGASTGIGEEYARRLAERGYALVLVARRGDVLETLAAEITARYGVDAQPLAADLGTDEGLALVVKRLQADGGGADAPVDLLVNNAARGDGGTFVEQEPDEIDSMIDVNVRSVLHLARAVLPVQIARREAGDRKTKLGVISMSSIAGEIAANPGGSVYGAGKKFVTLWSESVATEVARHDIHVTVVLPGFVRTNMTLSVQESGLPAFAFVPKDQVVREALIAWSAGRFSVVPGAQYKAATGLLRFLPKPLVRATARRVW